MKEHSRFLVDFIPRLNNIDDNLIECRFFLFLFCSTIWVAMKETWRTFARLILTKWKRSTIITDWRCNKYLCYKKTDERWASAAVSATSLSPSVITLSYLLIVKNVGIFCFLLLSILFFLKGYKKAEAALSSKHSNGGSLDRYTADPNQRGVQARADIIRPRPTPCKLQNAHPPHKSNSPVNGSACVYLMIFSLFIYLKHKHKFCSPEFLNLSFPKLL